MEKERLSPYEKLKKKCNSLSKKSQGMTSATKSFMEKSSGKRMDEGDRAPDIIGAYPREVHVTSLEGRRALWTARAFAIGMFMSIALNIVLAFVLSGLVPLKRVEPMLLTLSDKSEQIVRVQPFHKKMKGFDLLVEQSIKDYVLHREAVTMHSKEMNFRWAEGGYIAERTTPEAFMVFRQHLPAYQQIFDNNIQRDVTINSVSKLGPDYWTIEFQARDMDLQTLDILQTTIWQATMQIDFLPREVSYDERFMNPLGFTVKHYSVARKS